MSINNILIIDDHPIFLDGLSKIITSIYSDVKIFKAKSCSEAKEIINNEAIMDCIFLDYHLPDSNGIAFINELKAMKSIAPIVILTSESDIAIIHEAFEAGATGYLEKSSTTEDYKRCIKRVSSGEKHIDVELNFKLKHYRQTSLVTLNHYNNQLSERKKDILMMLKKGFSNQEISEVLKLSIRTVKAEVSELFAIFDVSNRNHCVAQATQIGIIK